MLHFRGFDVARASYKAYILDLLNSDPIAVPRWCQLLFDDGHAEASLRVTEGAAAVKEAIYFTFAKVQDVRFPPPLPGQILRPNQQTTDDAVLVAVLREVCEK